MSTQVRDMESAPSSVAPDTSWFGATMSAELRFLAEKAGMWMGLELAGTSEDGSALYRVAIITGSTEEAHAWRFADG